MKMNGFFIKLLAGLLFAAMLLTFAGCGEDVESDPISGDSETETVENTESESETETEDNGEVTFPRDEF